MESYKEILKSIEQAELHFEEGAIREGQKLVNRIRASFNNLENVPNKLRHKFNFIHAQSKYFDDISSYAANPKREELIEEAKQLIANKENLTPRKQANKIHELQGKWQLLDQSSKSASRSQWQAFKELVDRAWEPCAEFFDELNEVKKINKAKRLDLIEEINKFTTKASNKDSIQYLSKFLKNSFDKWQSYAPVSDSDFKDLKQSFGSARKPILELIKSIEDSNKKQKEHLIELVNDYVSSEKDAGINFFKESKQKFKSIGPAGFKIEKKLWDEFHKAGDKFFEEEKALQTQQIQLLSESLAALNIEDPDSIEHASKILSDSPNSRKTHEYLELRKAVDIIKQEQLNKTLTGSIEALKTLLPFDKNTSLKNLKIDNKIVEALISTQYLGNLEHLKKLVVEIEMQAGKPQTKTDEVYKQQIMLERLQSKFKTGFSEKERPRDIVVEFIMNAAEKKNSIQSKLWERCCDAYLVLLSQSR
ncbi:MAG: DUF349 domain-containing protein [Gammaproteobacteria bacterium]